LTDSAPRSSRRTKTRNEPQLSLAVRILLLAIGWILLILGIAGLVLPGLQGVLTLAAAAAFFSAGSQSFHRFLRERFRRWPRAWKRLERWRRKLVTRFGGQRA
jgi:uncharacterized membrane protein YbaN (DUF454 family)